MTPARLRRDRRWPALGASVALAAALGLLLPIHGSVAQPAEQAPPAQAPQSPAPPSAAKAAAPEPATRSAVPGAWRVPIGELDTVPSTGEGPGPRRQEAPDKAEPALPAEGVSRHTLSLPGRSLAFTAKVGAMAFEDAQGAAVADIGYFAYLLDGADPRVRPVTFVVNGGPGSASAWLQLGALGPWRLPITQDAAHPSAPADLLPNAETWLDFTDLVFIDPVGTGFSRMETKDKGVREKFWSVQGDISSLTVFIKRWVEANGRLDSPKVFAGESYGGFRAPRVAQAMQAMPGFGPSGVILISPALAMARVSFPGLGNALSRAASFPSLAAVIADAKGPVSADKLAAFEREAIGGYLPDFLAGPRDKAAVERLAGRMAAITGLDLEMVRQVGPRAAPGSFLTAIDRRSGRAFSYYDATEKRAAAYDGPEQVDGGDDLGGLSSQLARGMTRLTQGPLAWKSPRDYHVRGKGVGWTWTGSESVTALRTILVRDPTLRVLVVHGYADLVTPYFRTKLQLDQMPTIGADNNRVRLEVYGGGHMFYSRDASRIQLRKDAAELFEGIAARR